MSQQEQSSSLEACLNLLKGQRDEQRLAGLLLVTKFCKGDDNASILRVYEALGSQFLDRLLRTGMKKGPNGSESDNHDAYLRLAVAVLATLCRVPEIASSKEMVSRIPVILDVMSRESVSPVLEDCYEFLYLTSSANEDGVKTLFESQGIRVLASQISTFPDDSHLMELSTKLIQLVLSKVSLEVILNTCPLEMPTIVVAIMRQFAMLHSALKFDALHLLSAIFSSDYSASENFTQGGTWSIANQGLVRLSVHRCCRNPTEQAPAEKLHALVLAEFAVSITSERWLISPVKLPELREQVPADRCLLLVLESSRVEIAVLLNDIAYLKYEASNNKSPTIESIFSKRRHLAVAFALVEKIIKLVSVISEGGNLIEDNTLMKVINGLNETISLVLEYLQDARDHGQKKGDDLLASVWVVGSYLAETPIAWKDKVTELLPYMLSVEGEDEPSPFSSVCFLMPLLCQITMNSEGCKCLVSSGGHKAIVDCLVKLIGQGANIREDGGGIFLACDTILNLLTKRQELQLSLDVSSYIDLLKALTYWAENANDLSVIMMASSICSLVLDHTSEDALLNSGLDRSTCNRIYRLIARSLASVNRTSQATSSPRWTFMRSLHLDIRGGLRDFPA